MKKRMIIYGTSLSSGSGWSKMLQKRLPDWKVINNAKGGMNSSWGMDNFGQKVLKYNPHVVLMEFAVNDAYIKDDYYGTVGPDRSIQNIKFMIKKLKWCKVFYMTMNPPLDMFIQGRNPAEDRPRWAGKYATHRYVAEKAGAEVINITARWEALSTKKFLDYCPDGLHPNELGSKMITIPAILERLGL